MNLGVYKHKYCTDIAMKVIGSRRSAGGWRVIVYFVNIVNPKKPFLCSTDGMSPRKCVEFVTDEQRDNWEPYDAAV